MMNAELSNTQQLGRQLVEAIPEWVAAIDDSVLDGARARVVDTIGCALAGANDESVIRAGAARDVLGSGEATVWTDGASVSAAAAAFENGVASHALELDDYSEAAVAHPGVAVVPACLAWAEHADRSWEDALRGIVVAYEVFERIGELIQPGSVHRHGFHATSIFGPLGAAVGCLVTSGELSSERLLSALGIAASQSSGRIQYLVDGGWTKRFHAGWAAQGGVVAAALAMRSFKTTLTAIEGEHGVVRGFGEPSPLVETGARVEVPEAGEWVVKKAAYKMYACCGYNHAAITAALDLASEHGLEAEDVERVEVGLFDEAFPIIVDPDGDKRRPRSSVDAQFSVFHSVAIALTDGRAFIEEFSDRAAAREDLQRLRDAVEVVRDAEIEAAYPNQYGARVTLWGRDGRRHQQLCLAPVGSRGRPPSEAELREKLDMAARVGLGEEAPVGALLQALTDTARSTPTRSVMAAWRKALTANADSQD